MSLHYEDTGGENPFLDEEAGGPNDNNHKQGDLLLQNTTKTASDRSLGGLSTHSTATTTTPSDHHNARKLMMMIGAMACLVVTLIIIITVSVTLAVQSGNNNKSSSDQAAVAVVTEGPTSMVLTEAPTTEMMMISGEENNDSPLDNNNVVTEPTTTTAAVPSFSSDILQTYENRAALEADLTVAAMEIVRAEIAQNMELLQLFQEAAAEAPAPSNRGGFRRQRRRTQEEDLVNNSLFQPSTTSKSNNRERTVDEADTVKEDGNYVYAAYGDYLVVWDRQGNLLAQDRMAAPPADAFGNVLPAWIQGVQLTPNHVLVFCGGYSTFQNDPQALTTATNETKLHVYTRPTPDNPMLARVAEQTIHGNYHSSRVIVDAGSDSSSIQGTVHIVTGAQINLYTHLQEPLAAIYFTGAANNRTRYQEEATALATDTVVPKFVSQLADEMLQSSGASSGMPQIMKISNWKKEATAGEDSSSVGITSWDKALHSYVQILSIHPDALPTSEFIVDGLEFSKSAFLSPLSIHETHVYATDHHMVVAVEPFQYDLETSTLTEEVCLVHLKVATSAQDADSDHVVVTTNFHSVALLEGRLAGDDTFASRHHSIDIQGDDLRVAITHQTSYPMDRVVEICGPNQSPFFVDPCMTPEAYAVCHDMVLFDECVTVSKTECPFQFTCDEAAEEKSPSSTRNYVMVLSVKESGEMVELGGIMVGEDHEKITSVHLAKDFSYVTTSFLQSQGPFYVLSLPQEGAPAISATLQLDEVVSYLQPLNEAATLLVGIGQNSTGAGALEQDTGAMVSVFDVADPQAPVVLASRMLNREDGSKSSTRAQIDPKAVQYTSSGMLIIPMQLTPVATMPTEDAFAALNITDLGSYHNWDLPEVFEGFIVLDVSDPTGASGISEVLRVNHANPSGRCNYCDGMLQNHRAFSYEEDGSVMTIYNHKVISSNLTSASQNWALNITLIGQDMNCCL